MVNIRPMPVVKLVVVLSLILGVAVLYHHWAYPPVPLCMAGPEEVCPTEDWIRQLWELQKHDNRVHKGIVAWYQNKREEDLSVESFKLSRGMPSCVTQANPNCSYYYDLGKGKFIKKGTMLNMAPGAKP